MSSSSARRVRTSVAFALLAAALAGACATAPPAPPASPVEEPAATSGPPPAPPEGPPPSPAIPADVPPAPGDAQTPDSGAAPGEDPALATKLAWVNPSRCLPSCTYDPGPTLVRIDDTGAENPRGKHRVAAEVAPALGELLAAARAAGHTLRVASGYRSYREQARLYATIKEKGRAARPGHSEHQLGTAVDLRLPTTAAITWLAGAAPGLGFVLSYPPGSQRQTGYRPEPWHVRYLGRPLARELARRNLNIEGWLRARPELGQSGSCADCPGRASRAPCGKVSAAGRCDGTLLVWCYDGALAAVDCASSEQTCGLAPTTGQPDCL